MSEVSLKCREGVRAFKTPAICEGYKSFERCPLAAEARLKEKHVYVFWTGGLSAERKPCFRVLSSLFV